MKRAKDKYMINRTKYKDIKRYDHQQMPVKGRQGLWNWEDDANE